MDDKFNLTDMIIGFTGHRPRFLPGNYSPATYRALSITADFLLSHYRPQAVISGMALGWDTAVAECAINRGIELIAAIPFEGQEKRWFKADRDKYWQLLNRASHIEIVKNDGYSIQAMQLRNQYIVDNCHCLMALCNRTTGGTRDCINYALSVNRPTFNCWNTFVYYYGRILPDVCGKPAQA